MPASVAHPQPHTVTTALKVEAMRVGFDLVGIAPAVTPTGFHKLNDWLERGFAGHMSYIPHREAAYEHPGSILDGVRSVVMLAVNYRTQDPRPAGVNEGRVSRYAWGSRDYHDVLKEKLRQLADFLHEERPGCKTRGVVDTAPLLERDFARLAGLGWLGKNTMLINNRAGSWLFLAALLTDVELDYDEPFQADHCGTCTRCLEACPTGAFPEPYVLDARNCISYLTIELRNKPIPAEFRDKMGDWLFGCDICQDVCPWNHKAPLSDEPAFQPAPDLSPADAIEILQTDPEGFRRRFQHTPLYRPKRSGLLRNAAIVLGNTGDERAVPALIDALDDQEPLVRGAAAWALGQHGGIEAQSALQSRLELEDNADIVEELQAALTALPEDTVGAVNRS